MIFTDFLWTLSAGNCGWSAHGTYTGQSNHGGWQHCDYNSDGCYVDYTFATFTNFIITWKQWLRLGRVKPRFRKRRFKRWRLYQA